ncbi:MAG: DUF5063 domain-containing protein [Bacteroidales bacterium]
MANSVYPIFDKNVLEFITVALEYCRLVENVATFKKKEFAEKLTRIFPLLYLKATLLPVAETSEVFLEQFVSEEQYERLRTAILTLLEDDDAYLDTQVEDMKYSETPICCSIAEGVADIYQDVKNFVEVYRLGVEELMNEALVEITYNFKSYWGQVLVNVLRPLHGLCYAEREDEASDNDEQY